jgi:hypothetical protein
VLLLGVATANERRVTGHFFEIAGLLPHIRRCFGLTSRKK